jgi:hypothetical protein
MSESATVVPMDQVQKLSRDLAKAASTLSADEARYLVDCYYQMQEMRKAHDNRVFAMGELREPHELFKWFGRNAEVLEYQVQRALAKYAEGDPLGRWCLSLHGVGPVITAGLLANIDFAPWHCVPAKLDPKIKCCRERLPIEGELHSTCGRKRIEAVGHIWSFCGISAHQKWEPKTKRPWNAQLKTLCWKMGDCILKFSNSEKSFYGPYFRVRWEQEKKRNEQGLYAEQAKASLERHNYKKDTDAYKAYVKGVLPPAHILQRSKRWAVKLFLSHYFAVGYEIRWGEKPPAPYVFEHLGHKDIIPPPNWP